MTKRCSRCGQEKNAELFGKYSRSKDGLSQHCKVCKQQYDKTYYLNNPNRKTAIAASNEARRSKRLQMIGEYLETNPCVDCGETDIRVLGFDHVRDIKCGNVSTMVMQQHPWELIIEEIAKCDIRCANCHRKVTAERGGSWRALWDAS